MSQSACLSSKLGVKCVWHRKWNRCLSYEQSLLLPNEEGLINQCQEESRSHVANAIGLCSSLKDCNSCVQTSLKCGWCPSGSCIYDEQCKEPNEQSDGFSYVRVSFKIVRGSPPAYYAAQFLNEFTSNFCPKNFFSGYFLIKFYITSAVIQDPNFYNLIITEKK